MPDRECTRTCSRQRRPAPRLEAEQHYHFSIRNGVTVKIVDFGIARILSDDPKDRLTHKGEIVGSPIYMSPEQCRGREVDHRSDAYSLGCVMYEMISGKPPIEGSTYLETIQRHNDQLPKNLCSVRKGCPPQLEAIVMRCLEKTPKDRFATTNDLNAALLSLHSELCGSSTNRRPVAPVLRRGSEVL